MARGGDGGSKKRLMAGQDVTRWQAERHHTGSNHQNSLVWRPREVIEVAKTMG